MDEADMAQARMEMEETIRRKSMVQLEPVFTTGHCLWCDEPVAPGRRWCSTDCRDDDERYGR